jgi:hypothetical protein
VGTACTEKAQLVTGAESASGIICWQPENRIHNPVSSHITQPIKNAGIESI